MSVCVPPATRRTTPRREMSADGWFSRSISAAINLVDHYTVSGDDITGLCDTVPVRTTRSNEGRLSRTDPACLGGTGAAAPRPTRMRTPPQPRCPPYHVVVGRTAWPTESTLSRPCPDRSGRPAAESSRRYGCPSGRSSGSRVTARPHAQTVCAAGPKLNEALESTS